MKGGACHLGLVGSLGAGLLMSLLAGCSSGGTGLTGGDQGGEPGGGFGGGGGSGGGEIRGGGSGTSFNGVQQFTAKNTSSSPRTETVRASIPFVEGAVTSLANVGVAGVQAAWLPMQYWADGSVRVAQVQFTDAFNAQEEKTYDIVQNVQTLTGSFVQNNWVSQFTGRRIAARVQDTFGVPYMAEIPLTGGEVLQDTFLVRVTRHRMYHDATQQPNIGRDFLTSTFYVTEFQDVPFMIVDWVVGNDYLGTDDPAGKTVATEPNYFPLGAIDLKKAEFLTRGVTEVQAYLPGKHNIANPAQDPQGWTAFKVMENTFIDDGQTRRYRFMLRFENPGASAQEKVQWQAGFDAFVSDPIYPLATLATWQGTGGIGLHGGPVTGPTDALGRAQAEYNSWNGANWFGTWGRFGEVQQSGTTGTPRNTVLSEELAHAIQANYPQLVTVLEQKAWVQAVRPYHMFGLTVGTYEDILLWDEIPYYPGARGTSADSKGRKALWNNDPYPGYRTQVNFSSRAHGWNGYDSEHWSTDLLFDYWTISGDAWAREELRQLGESLKGLMRLQKYATAGVQAARAEGWCMVGFVQCYLATGDTALRDYALLRMTDIIEPGRLKGHPSKGLAVQESAKTGFPTPHKFLMPWQHAAVVYGYLGAHKFFGNSQCLDIAEDVVTTVEYSWVTNFTDPKFGFIANGLRYYTPISHNGVLVPPSYWDNTPGIGAKWGEGPLGGSHSYLVSAMHLLAERSPDPTVQSKALLYGNMILGPIGNNSRWYKWNFGIREWLLPQ